MNTTDESMFNVQDVPRLFSKYWAAILITTLLTTCLAVWAGRMIPKRYKAHFVLTIYSKYFQNPLIGDFVPGLSESQEMKSQREALIRQILTPEYLDYLGNEYKIYASGQPHWIIAFIQKSAQAIGLTDPPHPDSILSSERESLRKRIEIYSLNNTTFNVGFLYSDPDVTLKVTQDIYAQMIQSLLEVRRRIIGNVRSAIQSRIGSFTPQSGNAFVEPSETQSIEEELADVRSELTRLTAQYTEVHPLVMQMRDRERVLVNRLGYSPRSSPRRRTQMMPSTTTGPDPARDVYGDLMKKLNYLDIAIDSDKKLQTDYFAVLETPLYPAAPLWPKKALIALWGMALGFFGSLFVVAIKEFYDRSTLRAEVVAHQLGVPLLGELPAFPRKPSHR